MHRDATSLSSITAAARRHWVVIVVVAVLAALVGAAVSLAQPNDYQASTKVLIGSAATPTSANSIDTTEISTQSQVLTSLPVAKRVAKQLKLNTSPTDLLDDVTVVTDDTRVLTIDAVSSKADGSIAIANSFADQYLSYLRHQASRQQAQSRSALAAQVSALQNQIAALDSQIAGASTARAKVLTARRQALSVQLAQVTAQQSGANASSTTEPGQVLLRATSASPHSAVPLARTVVLAAILGLVVGFGIALLLDRSDDSIHDEEGLAAAAPGHAVMGRLPRWSSVGDDLISLQSPDSAASESFRQLGASLRSTLAGLPSKVGRGHVVVTASPLGGEGKTEVAANLAVTNARLGLQVVLVDANLRNRALSLRLKLGTVVGVSDVLTAPFPEPELVHVEQIHVLPAGSESPNPAEMLGSAAMAQVISQLVQAADLVIVDTAATLQFADAAELFGQADVVLMVCRTDKTTQRAISAATERAAELSSGPVGLVLNQSRTT